MFNALTIFVTASGLLLSATGAHDANSLVSHDCIVHSPQVLQYKLHKHWFEVPSC